MVDLVEVFRSDINYVVREDLDNHLLEILSIEIRKPNSKPFVVTSWFRPPNASPDLFSLLDTLLGRLHSKQVKHYLMSDMNCDLLKKKGMCGALGYGPFFRPF